MLKGVKVLDIVYLYWKTLEAIQAVWRDTCSQSADGRWWMGGGYGVVQMSSQRGGRKQ